MRLSIKSLFAISALTALAYLFVRSTSYTVIFDIISRNNGYADAQHSRNSTFPSVNAVNQYNHVWITFTKVSVNGGLSYKFESLLDSILVHKNRVPLHFNIITDSDSEDIARNIFKKLLNLYREDNSETNFVIITYYDVNWCADKIRDIINCMTPHFSSQPGSYYADALFYLSLGLHRIAPQDQEYIVLLDCDLRFKTNIDELFKEFNSFNSSNLFGLAHELSSVYRHVLYSYRTKHHDTRFGSELNYFKKIKERFIFNIKNDKTSSTDNTKGVVKMNDGNNIVSSENYIPEDKRGFPGFNSGVILLNLNRIRKSSFYEGLLTCGNVKSLTDKYSFKGHLGDQDFFTILGYENPNLFHKLDCGWNRQLCKWWRRYEDIAVFDDYFHCDMKVRVYHGNCNTAIPLD